MLEDFQKTTFSFNNKTRDIYRKGSGPAVIVIEEMPGITPKVVEFAEKVQNLGLSVVIPQLFGDPGAPPSIGRFAKAFFPACISKEFNVLALKKTSPIVDWLRGLARSLHDECGGHGVGVVGMCFTGGFALAMMAGSPVIAPVMSQPSLPFAISAKAKSDLGLSDEELAVVKERCDKESLRVIGLRFTNDKAVPKERFSRLKEELGDKFVAIEIDSSPNNAFGNPSTAHSCLTEHLVEEEGHPTLDGLNIVLNLFREKLVDS